jgi:quercetin dioxygenase-like cupin family protein
VVVILDGEVDVTVEDQTRRLGPGDVVVINRGVEHELRSEGGCTFFEALAPVPLDHVPDRKRDLVLGPDGGSQHVER